MVVVVVVVACVVVVGNDDAGHVRAVGGDLSAGTDDAPSSGSGAFATYVHIHGTHVQANLVAEMCVQRQQLREKILHLESALLHDGTAAHPSVPLQRYRTYGIYMHI